MILKAVLFYLDIDKKIVHNVLATVLVVVKAVVVKVVCECYVKVG